MNEMSDEDVARLQRRLAAQRAGIDVSRDMCAHDYVNGQGCEDCDRMSRRFELMIGFILILFVLATVLAGLQSGWF